LKVFCRVLQIATVPSCIQRADGAAKGHQFALPAGDHADEGKQSGFRVGKIQIPLAEQGSEISLVLLNDRFQISSLAEIMVDVAAIQAGTVNMSVNEVLA
jgi:hypothetical protein